MSYELDDLPITRPQSLDSFIGQKNIKENLKIFIQAAQERKEALDHVLLHGPPGLGKTTLAQIVALELGVNIKITSGPIILKSGDLAALLSNLKQGDVLFIDEIHRLHVSIEEILYTAMEDYKLDIMIGEGPTARSIRINLAPFTLIGATTRAGLLTQPLRERFGILLHLQYYALEELNIIIKRSANILKTPISETAAQEIAQRSRGTPRIAGRLLRRCRDFATVTGDDEISYEMAQKALDHLNIDPLGLDQLDQKYLSTIFHHHKGGPVGIDTLAIGLSEKKDTIEDVVEPFLIQQGLIKKTPRGRMLTELGFEHLGLKIEL